MNLLYLVNAAEVLLELVLDVLAHAGLDLLLHHALHVHLGLDHLAAPRAVVQHALRKILSKLQQ